MLQKVKGLVKQETECHTCGESVDGSYVLEDVKVPGYTGRHEKPFCNEDCLQEWKKHVREWEEDNYEIPMTNKGPACGGC